MIGCGSRSIAFEAALWKGLVVFNDEEFAVGPEALADVIAELELGYYSIFAGGTDWDVTVLKKVSGRVRGAAFGTRLVF